MGKVVQVDVRVGWHGDGLSQETAHRSSAAERIAAREVDAAGSERMLQ